MWYLLIALLGLAAGGGAGFALRKVSTKQQVEEANKQVGEAKEEAKKLLADAQTKQEAMLLEAKKEALKISEAAKDEEQKRRDYLISVEQRLSKKEEVIDQKTAEAEAKQQEFLVREKEIETIKDELKSIRDKQEERLQEIAKMNKQEAKDLLLEMVEKDTQAEMVKKIRQVEEAATEEADKKAREILTSVMQRYAAPTTAETTVSTVHLPSDELKGRIIGREGRNIQALEKLLGVDLIIDDTPEAVVVSCFDPIRRHIAKVTIDRLIEDGRIHPARIETIFAEVKKDVAQQIKESGEQAVYEIGVTGLPAEVIKILGRLRFRTSYGQNVLKHSMECAYIAGMLAEEVGADVRVCKTAALLHDLGKALDHEIPGSHAIIGRDIAKKFGLPEVIVKAIAAHHEDVKPETAEELIVQISDAISSARPGARRDSLESYVKRLTELENIANEFPGVEKSFAIQAGREIRVLVKPEDIDDLGSVKLAREVAQKIEETMTYPGQIKVNVIRETRAVDYAK